MLSFVEDVLRFTYGCALQSESKSPEEKSVFSDELKKV